MLHRKTISLMSLISTASPSHSSARKFPVTKNLEIALQNLRSASGRVAPWVDALCINQKDNKEKTKQVQLMKEICTKARKTWILLGPRTPNSDRAMDVVARIDAEGPDSEENELASDDLKPLAELLEKP